MSLIRRLLEFGMIVSLLGSRLRRHQQGPEITDRNGSALSPVDEHDFLRAGEMPTAGHAANGRR
jgi:hypothetical protein